MIRKKISSIQQKDLSLGAPLASLFGSLFSKEFFEVATGQKLTTNEKWEIGVTVGFVVLLLLLAYANGAGQQSSPLASNVTTPSSPDINTPTIWQPNTSPININGGNINVTNTPGNTYTVGQGVSCSCGCNNQASFGSLSQMEQSYVNQYNTSLASLFAASLAALPAYFAQYVNNFTGWAESLAADNALQ